MNQKDIDKSLEIFRQCPEMCRMAFFDEAKEWQSLVNLVYSIKAACSADSDGVIRAAPGMHKYWGNFSVMAERLYPEDKARQLKLIYGIAVHIITLDSKNGQPFTKEDKDIELLNMASDLRLDIRQFNDA